MKPSGAVLAKVVKGAVTGPVRIADDLRPDPRLERSPSRSARTRTEERVQAAVSSSRCRPRTPTATASAPARGHAHQGQDIFAACGSPLVAAHSGKVVKRARPTSGSAGNYVVIDAAGIKQDYVYMHLKKPARGRQGPAR